MGGCVISVCLCPACRLMCWKCQGSGSFLLDFGGFVLLFVHELPKPWFGRISACTGPFDPIFCLISVCFCPACRLMCWKCQGGGSFLLYFGGFVLVFIYVVLFWCICIRCNNSMQQSYKRSSVLPSSHYRVGTRSMKMLMSGALKQTNDIGSFIVIQQSAKYATML